MKEGSNVTNKITIYSSIMSRTKGGIENTTYYLANEFAKTMNVDIYVNNTDEMVAGINIHILNEHNSLFRLVKGIKLSKANAKDTQELCFCLNWRNAVVPFFNKRPYIVLCHGNDVLDKRKKTIKFIFEKILRKMILNNAICVCANSQYTANLVKAIRTKDEPVIIHPCSGEYVDFNERCTKNSFLLSIGRLEERKGLQYAIVAFKELNRKQPELKYYIAGDGPYRMELQRIIDSNGIQEKCILLGRVSEEEKQKLLKTCDVLVMPSYYNKTVDSVEGFGIVYIEANAHGKPVVGTYSGGIPDAIINEKTGLLVEENNVEQLVNAIDAILSERVNITEKACKEWAAEHYYPEIAKKYLNLIKKLA